MPRGRQIAFILAFSAWLSLAGLSITAIGQSAISGQPGLVSWNSISTAIPNLSQPSPQFSWRALVEAVDSTNEEKSIHLLSDNPRTVTASRLTHSPTSPPTSGTYQTVSERSQDNSQSRPNNADSSSKSPRFNVEKYTGSMSNVEQLFSASKVDSSFLSSATISTANDRQDASSVSLEPWYDRVYTWSAPQFYHRPLYFEQVNLERYGIGARPVLQPAHATIHFYSSIVLWPAKLLVNQPNEPVSTLGHQRPGDRVCYQRWYSN